MLGRCPEVFPASELGDHSYVAYLNVDSVDEFHERAVAEQADVLKPQTNRPWGMREMALRNPDGFRLRRTAPVRPRAADCASRRTVSPRSRARGRSSLTERSPRSPANTISSFFCAVNVLHYFRCSLNPVSPSVERLMLSRPPDHPSGATRLRDCPALHVSYLSTPDRGADLRRLEEEDLRAAEGQRKVQRALYEARRGVRRAGAIGARGDA